MAQAEAVSANIIPEALLKQYGLADECELEVYYPGAKALLASHANDNDKDVQARLVRVAAANKALVQRGLPSLSCGAIMTTVTPPPATAKDSTTGTLTPEELRALEPSESDDGGGLVLGILVGSRFYRRCVAKCRSKRARAMEPPAFKQFISRFLKELAKEQLHREALGLHYPHHRLPKTEP